MYVFDMTFFDLVPLCPDSVLLGGRVLSMLIYEDLVDRLLTVDK